LVVFNASTSSLALVVRGGDAANDSNTTAVGQGQGQGHRKLSTYTLTFSYTGSVQQWVVPAGLAAFTVDAYGAQGGFFNYNPGGLGGYISVSNIVASSFVGQTLFIYVGAFGASNTAPGLGGGGTNLQGTYYADGGGASDLRTSLNDITTR